MEADHIGLTSKGKQKIIKDGYGYVKEKCGTGDVVYWRCERKDEFGCKGRLKTNDTTIAAITGMHSHAPEATRVAVATVTDAITRRAGVTQESTHTIVQAAVAAAPIEAVTQLPSVRSLKRKAQRESV